MIVVVLVAAVVAVALSSGKTRSPQATVLASVNQAIAQKGAHMKLTGTIGVAGQSVKLDGTGVVDFASNSAQMTMSVMGINATVDIIGGNLYMQIPQLSQLEPGKSWVELNLSNLIDTSGQSPSGNLLGSNPATMLKMLTQQGAQVTKSGTRTLNGVSTEEYSVSYTPAAIDKIVNNMNLPPAMRSAISNVHFTTLDAKVYIGPSNTLARTTLDMKMQVDGRTVSASETMDLSDYGASAQVTAPPASSVVDYTQFMKDALNSARSGN